MSASKHYDVCPRAPDLEEFHVDIAVLKTAMAEHSRLLTSHNGYIRENQNFQNKVLGGMVVIGAMSGLAAAFSILARV